MSADVWALTAPFYDLFVDARGADDVLELLGPDAGRVRHGVLEVGAGTGRIGLALADAFPGLPVVLAEPSAAMRQVMSGKLAQRAGLRGRVSVLAGGVGDTRPAGRVDLVLCIAVAWALPPGERRAAWDHLAGLLRGGGLLVLDLAPPAGPASRPWRASATAARGDERVTRTVWGRPVDAERQDTVFEFTVERPGAATWTERSRATVWTPSAEAVSAELAAAGFVSVRDRVTGDGERLALFARRPPVRPGRGG